MHSPCSVQPCAHMWLPMVTSEQSSWPYPQSQTHLPLTHSPWLEQSLGQVNAVAQSAPE